MMQALGMNREDACQRLPAEGAATKYRIYAFLYHSLTLCCVRVFRRLLTKRSSAPDEVGHSTFRSRYVALWNVARCHPDLLAAIRLSRCCCVQRFVIYVSTYNADNSEDKNWRIS